MLEQLRRLVSSNGGEQQQQPSASRHHLPPQVPFHHALAPRSSGSLGRMTAYNVGGGGGAPHLPVHRVVSYAVPVRPVVAFDRNGRPVVYEPWITFNQHYHAQQQHQQQQQQQHQRHQMLARQTSAGPELLSVANSSSKKLKSNGNTSSNLKTTKKNNSRQVPPPDVMHHRHPTVQRRCPAVASPSANQQNNLTPSRSLDSIHPRRIVQQPVKESVCKTTSPPPTPPPPPLLQSTGSRVKDFFQRLTRSTSSSGSNSSVRRKQEKQGETQSSADWLLQRPSVHRQQVNQQHNHQRPSTPGANAFRRLFGPSSPVQPQSRGDPDGATLPSHHLDIMAQVVQQQEERLPSPPPPSSLAAITAIATSNENKTKKDEKEATAAVNGNGNCGVSARVAYNASSLRRVRRRQSKRLSGRHRRSVHKKKPPVTKVMAVKKAAAKTKKSLSMMATAATGSRSSLAAGDHHVSDWTYLPLPSSTQMPPAAAPPPPPPPPVQTKEVEEDAPVTAAWETDLYAALLLDQQPSRRNHQLPPLATQWDLAPVQPDFRRLRRRRKQLLQQQQQQLASCAVPDLASSSVSVVAVDQEHEQQTKLEVYEKKLNSVVDGGRVLS